MVNQLAVRKRNALVKFAQALQEFYDHNEPEKFIT
jgi:hypothetical protein